MPDWKRMLDEIDGDLAALEASKAELLDVRAKIAERIEAEAKSGLSTKQSRSILRSNMHLENAPTTKSVRIAAGRTQRKHPAKRAWLEAGKTDQDIADECAKVLRVEKVGRSTVNSWCAKGDAARPVPSKIVEHFAKPPYRIPRDAWAKIGD